MDDEEEPSAQSAPPQGLDPTGCLLEIFRSVHAGVRPMSFAPIMRILEEGGGDQDGKGPFDRDLDSWLGGAIAICSSASTVRTIKP